MGRAGVTRYVYRKDKCGNLRALRVDECIPYRTGETLESLEERVTKDLHHLECEQGSRFQGIGEFSTSMLKRVWIDNREKDAAFDRARDEAFTRARERAG
jgi:hypothetical protein